MEMFKVRAKWDDASRAFINRTIGHFADRIAGSVQEVLRAAREKAVQNSRPLVPRFEGDLARDLAIRGIVRRPGVAHWSAALGFSSATNMPSYESLTGPTPFSIAQGKHAGMAAKKHRVMLWNPRTGTPRRKLMRWLRQNASATYGMFPENLTEDIYSRMVKSRQFKAREAYLGKGALAPWVWVDPSRHAPDFLFYLANPNHPLAQSIEYELYRRIARIW